jgi:lysophospholipid acyltransferase (LPLAT)-like uncharacterized protein
LLNIYIHIAAFLFYFSINLVCRSLRFNQGWKEDLDRASSKGNVLFAVWHQATFAMLYLYRRSGAVILVTEETRGKILARCAGWMGYQPIAVPTLKEHFDYARSLARMLKLIGEGKNAVMAVDGPCGPLFEVKPGVSYIASRAGVPIVPAAIKAPWKLTLFWRWDKYFIPLPFSRVALRVGEAIRPDEHARAGLERELQRLSQ